MDINQLQECIIQPALKPLNLWSIEAESLLCSTIAQESLGGKYVKQVGLSNGALGIFQMEISCHDLHWRTNLGQPKYLSLVRDMLNLFGFSRRPDATDMIWHLGYATFMARVHYLCINRPLPPHDNLDEQWAYYKKWWNTELGAATEEQFLKNVKKYKGMRK